MEHEKRLADIDKHVNDQLSELADMLVKIENAQKGTDNG
jgi:hypothetical protein